MTPLDSQSVPPACLAQAPKQPRLARPGSTRTPRPSGATPVGTRVQAKLAVGTLVNRVVIPQNAVLSGEVIESLAKSATGPSRLAIRMDSARWKNGSAPLKGYWTAWYYPLLLPDG